MDGEIHGKGEPPPGTAAAPPPVTGQSNLSFAQQVAVANKKLTALTNVVQNIQDQRETETNDTPAQLNDQLNQNTQLLNEANDVASYINELQTNPDANQSEINQLKSTLNTLASEITTLTKGTAEALSAYMDVQNTSNTGANNYSNIKMSTSGFSASPQPQPDPPAEPPADPPASSDGPNLFLATGMMAILMKIELGLVKQTELNMDSERQVKQKDFENVRGMATAAAQSAYNKDMAQANSTLAGAIGSFVSAGLGLAAGLGGMFHAGAMRDNLQQQKDEMVNNPKFEEAYEAKHSIPWDPAHPNAAEPIVNPDGTRTTPGISQMKERLDYLNSKKDPSLPVDDTGGTSVTVAGSRGAMTTAEKDEHTKLTADLDKKNAEYEGFNVDMQYAQLLNSDPKQQMWNSLKNLAESLPQAISQVIASTYQMQEAIYDKNQIMAQMAEDMANKGLSSAMDAFSGELKNAQTILETIIQAQSKNTQWRNISA